MDDDSLNLTSLSRVLSRGGFHVLMAENGERALSLLEADTKGFSALLLDRRMPRLDGLQVLRRLKQSHRFRDLPVIFQTAMDRAEDIIEGLQAGAYYYLTKPLDPKMVLAVVSAATKDYSNQKAIHAELERTRAAISCMEEGRFRYQTLHGSHELASLLAKTCPDPNRVVLGLSELMINALEHGNLGITFEEKTALIEAQRWEEEIARRQRQPENLAKWVTVHFRRTPDRIRFEIQDVGSGFQWQRYQEFRPELLFNTHGRGILMARMNAFDQVEYSGCGNHVMAEVRLNASAR